MRECRRLGERETDVENGKMDGGWGGLAVITLSIRPQD